MNDNAWCIYEILAFMQNLNKQKNLFIHISQKEKLTQNILKIQ